MKHDRRSYRCTNQDCDRAGVELLVRATVFGPFLEWPNLRCVCGMEPMIIDPAFVLDGEPSKSITTGDHPSEMANP